MQLLPKSENSCRENQKHHDKTFDLIDKLTGEINVIVVFVAVLPHSQYIYVDFSPVRNVRRQAHHSKKLQNSSFLCPGAFITNHIFFFLRPSVLQL